MVKYSGIVSIGVMYTGIVYTGIVYIGMVYIGMVYIGIVCIGLVPGARHRPGRSGQVCDDCRTVLVAGDQRARGGPGVRCAP
jgi:hypothetical protein